MGKFNFRTSILAVAASALLCNSCTNLDEVVYSKILAEETNLSADDVTSIIAPAYASLRTVYWGWDGLSDTYEESSDCIVVPNRIGIGWGEYYVDVHKHTWTANLSWHASYIWTYTYSGITNVNRAIYQLEQIEGLESKDAYINELRALRTFYYYILLDNFRNVPVVTDYDVPDGYLPEQNTAQEVYDFIISELTETMSSLSEDNTTATYGRFTKWAAKMLLAKLYLNHEVYFGTSMWTEAQSEVQDIIDCEKFSLADDYLDPFLAENESSVEEIFSIPFDAIYANEPYYAYKTLYAASQATYNLSATPWGGSGMIPQFIDTYDSDDSRLTDCYLGGLQYTKAGDPLMIDVTETVNGESVTVSKQFEYLNYLTHVDSCKYNEGYRLVKYEILSGSVDTKDCDVPVFRYTDALMIKAECLLRLGKSDEAATIISEIRQRDFKNNPDKATVTGARLEGGSSYKYGTYARGSITNYEGGDDIQYGGFLDELAWEFVGEHHRKQDLIRFGVYNRKSWFCKEGSSDEEYRSVFPIPQEILNTNSNLQQNTGY
jgi:starch-binding outer membrane protein, SusD/RagB family